MLTLPVLLLLIVAVGGSGFMVAILAWLFQRLNRLESARQDPRLEGDFEALREQLGAIEAELSSIAERVDFTENLLEKPETADSPRLPPS